MTTPRQRNAQGQYVKAGEEVKDEAPQEKRPTREHVWLAAHWMMTHTNVVPTAYGPTAVGKTVGVYEVLAKMLDAKMVSVLLEHYTPDEVCGFQTIINGELKAAMPFWWDEAEACLRRNQNVIIFLDELGLAQEATHGAVLTFLRDRQIHGKVLGEGIETTAKAYVVAAMNPALLAPTMMTRIAMFHVPADRDYLRMIAGSHSIALDVVDNSRIAIDNPAHSAYDNSIPPAREVVDAAAVNTLTQIDKDFYRLPTEAQDLIISALLPRDVAERTLRKLRSSFELDVKALIEDEDLFKEALRKMTPQKAVSTILSSVLESRHDPMLTIEVMTSVFDVLVRDTNKLRTYYNGDKPQEYLDAINALNPQAAYWHKKWEDEGYVFAENNELKGKWIDELLKSPEVTHEG